MSALQSRLSTPPAPNPGTANGVLSSGVSPQGPSAPQGQAPQQAAPAPSHAQTVAALRHFTAIASQLELALKDPDIGKADIKSKVIDGMTSLVAKRIIPAGQAVTQLATFPERPFEQKQWLVDHMQQVMQARDAILTHHAMANAGGGPEETPDPDNHIQDMAGMMASHYGAQRA